MSSATPRIRDQLLRLLQLAELLAASTRGCSVRRLIERLERSRATVYRDLNALEASGVPVYRTTVNGERVYHLDQNRLPTFKLSAKQLLALQFARLTLHPLEGTEIVRELDALLGPQSLSGADFGPLVWGDFDPTAESEVLRGIEQAIMEGRQLRFHYRKPRGEPELRTVDPCFQFLRASQVYLAAYDRDRQGPRTFKLLRMEGLDILDASADVHPEIDEGMFKHAVKVWSGEPTQVVIEIDEELADIAKEWPLVSDQVVEQREDGSVVVRATTAGIVEPLRWVLRWGRAARVQSPRALRDLVVAELDGALAWYDASAK